MLGNLELASLPTTSDEERRRLLSFVVSGGGPTGVEFAAELFDMLNEDLGKSFPKILRNEISVHVIQSRGHILNTYDEALSKFAEARFAHDQVEVLTNSRVKEVQPNKILFTQKDENGETVTKELPMGFCLWSTGVAQTELSKKIADKIDIQTNKHALETDTHLRLNGAPLGSVYAVGDCSTVQNNVADHLIHFLRGMAWEKGQDPETMHITFKEWRDVAQKVKKRFPQASDHLRRLDKLFEQYDKDRSGTLDFGELRELLIQIDNKLTSLPATAQRAHQQGQYLGRKLNKLAAAAPGMKVNEMNYGDLDEAVYKAFEYHHMGSLAYIGNSAIFDFNGLSFSGGLLAVYLWRSVYFAQSVSFRTRVLLAMDWSKRALFGRGESTPNPAHLVKLKADSMCRYDELLARIAAITYQDYCLYLDYHAPYSMREPDRWLSIIQSSMAGSADPPFNFHGPALSPLGVRTVVSLAADPFGVQRLSSLRLISSLAHRLCSKPATRTSVPVSTLSLSPLFLLPIAQAVMQVLSARERLLASWHCGPADVGARGAVKVGSATCEENSRRESKDLLPPPSLFKHSEIPPRFVVSAPFTPDPPLPRPPSLALTTTTYGEGLGCSKPRSERNPVPSLISIRPRPVSLRDWSKLPSVSRSGRVGWWLKGQGARTRPRTSVPAAPGRALHANEG